MSIIKTKLKILCTNWINLVGVFLTTFLSVFIVAFTHDNTTIFQALFATLISIVFYGCDIWLGLVIAIVILDIVLINKSTLNKITLHIILFLEWVIISSPFIYWAIKFNEWVFVVGVLAFYITQNLRKKTLLKLIFNEAPANVYT